MSKISRIGSFFSYLFLHSILLLLQEPPYAAESTYQNNTTSVRLENLALDIPATKMTLKNGLTLIVNEDHSNSRVSIRISYNVGSKNEKAGQTGFAHLFEHLMFSGSENFDHQFFKATGYLGATQQNGETSLDRTEYYQTVPKGALDTILWLESDRMGHLLGALTQEKLDIQRAVVQNEKLEGDNSPYAMVDDLFTSTMIPKGHPYDHTPIGSVADLNSATLEDVKEWFKTYYTPNNTTIVLSGDVTLEEAANKIQKYFGDIPPGEPISFMSKWVIAKNASTQTVAYDRVAQPKIMRIWNVSEYSHPDTDYLSFLANILAGDRNSILTKRLIQEENLATSVDVTLIPRELAGQFLISVKAKPDADVDRIEKILDEELKKVIESGLSKKSIFLTQMEIIAGLAQAIENTSWKAEMLSNSQTFLGSPDGWKVSFNRLKNITSENIQKAAKKWLQEGEYRLHIFPTPNFYADKTNTVENRKEMPLFKEENNKTQFPQTESATLPNGLKVIVSPKEQTTMVNFSLFVRTGFINNLFKDHISSQKLVSELLVRETKKFSTEQLIDSLKSCGANVTSTSDDYSGIIVSMSTLNFTVDCALNLYANILMHPIFSNQEILIAKEKLSAYLESEKNDPLKMGQRLINQLTFGPEHPYSQLVTADSINKIQQSDLFDFHRLWFQPTNVTLVITGNTSMAQIRPKLERIFRHWKPATVPESIDFPKGKTEKSTLYIIHKPESRQTVIKSVFFAPPKYQGNEIARQIVNTILGGSFMSRLNMKLREEKGWSYGAKSRFFRTNNPRFLLIDTAVQTDKTAEAVSEIAQALLQFNPEKVSEEELLYAKKTLKLKLMSDWQSSSGVMIYLLDQTTSRLPENFYKNYLPSIEVQTLDDLKHATQELLNQSPTWIIVTDLNKIKDQLPSLNQIGEVKFIDSNGEQMSNLH